MICTKDTQFKNLLYKLSSPILIIDEQNTVQFINKSFLEYTNLSEKNVIGSVLEDLYQEIDISTEANSLAVDFLNENNRNCFFKQGDNHPHYFLCNHSKFKDNEGKLNFIIEWVDITKQKTMKTIIDKAENQLKLVIDNLPFHLWTMDDNWKYILQNEYSLKYWGNMTGKTIDDLNIPDNVKKKWKQDNEKAFNGETVNNSFELKLDEQILYFDNIITPIIYDGKIEGILGISMDVSEKVRSMKEKEQLENEIQQTRKMEAIGTLAGGIAHDFNNILTSVIGHTYLTRRKVEDNPQLTKYLDQVLIASHRAKELVKQILTFSRQSESENIVFHPAQLIEECFNILRPAIPATIEMNKIINNNVGSIFADPSKIHQIIINICTNAYQAMEKTGGKLNIIVQNIKLTEKDIPSEPDLKPGNFVQITINDNGPGIPEDIIDKIFNPYFTTKEKGKGTGMGLSVTHGIVKSYGGFIKVDSTPNTNTSFHIFLPGTSKTSSPYLDHANALPKGTEHILFVDDEEIITSMFQPLFESLGYKVSSFNKSTEALNFFKENKDKIDILITDLTMPEITGYDLALQIKKSNSDIPILLCSGYASNISKQEIQNLGITQFILKPLIPLDISTKIRETLDKKIKTT